MTEDARTCSVAHDNAALLNATALPVIATLIYINNMLLELPVFF